MRIVAVSQRVDFICDNRERHDALDQSIIRFLFACGFIGIPVPNISKNNSKIFLKKQYFSFFKDVIKPSAFLLSGGNDIGESPDRDETESAIINYAKEKELPLLGICRGMQMMAFSEGTSLVPMDGHAGTRHQIDGEISGEVNSYHNFSIVKLGKNINKIAWTKDGSIEVFKHQKKRILGIMWHPERYKKIKKFDLDFLRKNL